MKEIKMTNPSKKKKKKKKEEKRGKKAGKRKIKIRVEIDRKKVRSFITFGKCSKRLTLVSFQFEFVLKYFL